MERTLVLDSNWQPINAVPWQKAMSYVMREKGIVLEEYDHLVHADVQMPAVVRLTTHVKQARQKVKFSRVNIIARDRSECQYCGTRLASADVTYDHVIPRSQGGKTVWQNIVVSCSFCNSAKANRTPEQAEMRLRRKPERPSWVPLYNPRLRVPMSDVPPQWRNYWMTELEP
jgi:5-methylcytosine-specific restriction endonuclease McrA